MSGWICLKKVKRWYGGYFRTPIVAIGMLSVILWGIFIIKSVKKAYLNQEDQVYSYLVDTSGCQILDVEAFHPEGRPHFKGAKKQLKCPWPVVLLIGDKLVYNKTHELFSKTNCCCSVILRKNQDPSNYNKSADRQVEFTPCQEIPSDGLTIPDEHLRITCTERGTSSKHVDHHYFYAKPKNLTHKSTITRKKEQFWSAASTTRQQNSIPSVLIIGISHMSRNSMIRTMPKSRRVLLQEDFVELQGYTKIGRRDDTFFGTLVGSMNERNHPLGNRCLNPNKKVDNCPFIWRDFSEANYITGLLEDTPGSGPFGHYSATGFVQQPTDYYFRPFGLAYQLEEKILGESRGIGMPSCVGGYPETKLLLNYTADFLRVTKDVPYFLWTWQSSDTHMDLNGLTVWDDEYASFFNQTLSQAKGQAHEPVVIVLSEGGHEHGRFRTKFQGFYEEGLPIALIRIPKSIKDERPQWYESLRMNANRLTTAEDIHKTLIDILGLSSQKLASQRSKPPFVTKNEPDDFSISLFENVPENRSCESVAIHEEFCRCNVKPHERFEDAIVDEVIEHLMAAINRKVTKQIQQGLCVPIEMEELAYLKMHDRFEIENGRKVEVRLIAVGILAAVVETYFDGFFKYFPANDTLALVKEPTPRSLHPKFSKCVQEDDENLKNFCLCKDAVQMQR